MQSSRILIVEDEHIIIELVQVMLESLGYTIAAIATSGEESIQKVVETSPDLVLMDIQLHGAMDGIEAARQMRTRFNIPVVYLTAYTDQKKLERAKVTEPFGYIVKPFKERELKSAIEMAIYKAKTEGKLKAFAEELEDKKMPNTNH